jgi:outer membrane beta-barrel protein
MIGPRRRTCAALLLAAVALAAGPAQSQPDGPHWEVAPTAGYTLFDENIFLSPPQDNLNMGGRLSYFINNMWAFEVLGGFTPTELESPATGDLDFLHYGVGALWFPFAKPAGGPFLALGGGGIRLNPSSGDGQNRPQATAGLGVRYFLSENIGLTAEARDVMAPAEGVTELGDLGSDLTHNMVISGGITLSFGGSAKDSDGDGVTDRQDTCPDTPAGATVNAEGCPQDADGDGVFDGIDQCANTAKGAMVDARGCPKDSDRDGVLDGVDQCADTPEGAKVGANGCPTDADADGVFDGIDTCPNSPKGARVDSVGCPRDSDGDGVLDGLDKCADTPKGARVDVDGCPIEVMERETEMLETGMLRLQNINFETGKSAILADSYPALDVVGAVLVKWPEVRMEVGGHTDSRGSAELNQSLSEKRAQSVVDYLVGRFPIKRDMFTVKGYGESKPLVPNTDALNMAKNRRVELVVQNQDVLKRASEKKRMLQKNE